MMNEQKCGTENAGPNDRSEKCRTKNAEAETLAPTSGRCVHYVVIRKLSLHNIRGYWAAELCVTMKCANIYSVN